MSITPFLKIKPIRTVGICIWRIRFSRRHNLLLEEVGEFTGKIKSCRWKQVLESGDSKSVPFLAEQSYICCGEVAPVGDSELPSLCMTTACNPAKENGFAPCTANLCQAQEPQLGCLTVKTSGELLHIHCLQIREQAYYRRCIISEEIFAHFTFYRRIFIKSTICLLYAVKSTRWLW